MSDPEGRDYNELINALADVNILSVEAIGMVIGRCVGKIHQGMLDSGVNPVHAERILNGATREFFAIMLKGPAS